MLTGPTGANAEPTLVKRMRRAFLVLAALTTGAGSGDPIRAQDRLFRTFAHEHGLAPTPVWALAQDSVGFLWIGAEGGLFRFDGSRMQRWAPDLISVPVADIAVAPDGRIVAVDNDGQVYEIVATGARRLALRGPVAPVIARTGGSVAFDRDGDLWLIRGDSVLHLARNGRTAAVGPASFAGERPRLIGQTAFGGALIATDSTLWRVLADTGPQRVFSARVIVDVIEPEAGRVLVLLNAPDLHVARVVEVRNGIERNLLAPEPQSLARAISLQERHGTIWVALDRYLISVRPGQAPVIMGRDEGIESGGPLLVDREGSLWLGSFVGLHQYPEPETRLWAERQGLPSRHTRYLARTGNAVWIMTWGGSAVIRHGADGWTTRSVDAASRSNICADGRGSAWTASGAAVHEIRDTVVTAWAVQRPVRLDGCTSARGGGVWLGTPEGLLHIDPVRQAIQRIPAPPFGAPGAARPALLHDSRDRVWVGAGAGICHTDARRILSGATDAWTCAPIPGPGGLTGMVELPGGRLWASSDRQGLLVLDGDRWRARPMEAAPTRTIFALVPSQRGGVWIVGSGILMRVSEDEAGGWTVHERLTAWHGLHAAGGGDLAEDDDGTLWIATGRGVVQIPGDVRFAAPSVPPIALVAVRIDDRAGPVGALVLPHDRNRLELSFAALSFRDRSLVRHQVRLGPGEPWTESGGEPSFRWLDLRPGEYQIEYRASVDGSNWSTEPIRFAFSIRPPWYATTWFLLLAATMAGVLVWATYRARVVYLLGLERQRTRIAMDLHDEVGSGLASVGILSGVLASDGLDEADRRKIAADIADAAEELGNALSDIVWSLDPHASTMEELASRLAEHGERLCAAGRTTFTARFATEWPVGRPDVAVRRNVLLIGLEALHNAVRHADARQVTLSLLPMAGGRWMLSVRDDGAGLPDATTRSRAGRGLPGMQHRADEIGAALSVRNGPGHGTTVTLLFRSDLHARPHRMIMRVRARR